MTRARDLSQVLNDVGSISTNDIANGAVTQVKLDSNINLGVRVASVAYPGDDTAADPAGGQTVTITGAGFAATPTVYIDSTLAPSVTYVSPTQITFVTPAKSAGTYNLFVINPDGSTAISVMGISYSGTPAWTTPAGNLGTQNAAAISFQLVATGDTPLVYSLTSGSTLPAGVTLSSSGLVSGAVPTAQTFSFSVDVTDPQYQTTPRSFSITVTLGEAYFRYVTLLLHGNQPSGVTDTNNNVFKDSSTNNFTITRNPASGPNAPTQGTFSPFSRPNGRWSNYYDSTLTAWSEVLWTELSGISWTVEFWFYPVAQGGQYGGIIFGNNVSGRADSCYIYHASNGTVGIGTAGSSNFTNINSTTALPLNQWTHVAITISGSSGSATGKIYLNGVLDKTQTSMNTGINGMGYALTGSRGDNAYYNIYGYLSNLRIVKNQILYTGNFTPATAPLTTTSVGTSGANVAASITGTVSTLIYNNAYLTNSGATVGSAAGGSSARAQTFSPFPATVAYTSGANGGSVYFDGGNFLSVNQSAFVATGDFTIEAWFYQINQPSGYQGILSASGNGGSTGFRITTDNNTLNFWFNGTAVGFASIPQGQWNHVAISRTGTASNNVSCYLNGVRVGQITNTGSTTNSSLVVGRYYNDLANYYFQGHVSGLRLIVGSGIYSGSTITIPTAPPTAVSSTQLLLNYTNAAIVDNAMANDLETVGNAAISTVQSKWGGGSMYFNPGETNPLIIPHNKMFDLSSGDFTIEFWVYLSADRTYNFVISKGTSNAREWGVNVGPSTVRFYWSTNGLGTGDSLISASATLPTATWMHIAVTRSGSSVRIFKDGTQIGTTGTFTSMYSGTAPVYVGRFMDFNNISHDLSGYLDDLRITKGYARYTANFTAPVGPFVAFGD